MSIPVYYLNAVPPHACAQPPYVMLVPGMWHGAGDVAWCSAHPSAAYGRAHVCGSGAFGHVFEMSPTEKTTIDSIVAELPTWLEMLEKFLTDVEVWNHAEKIWEDIRTSHKWDYDAHLNWNNLFWNVIKNDPAYNWSQSMQNIMRICTKLLLTAKTQNLESKPSIFFDSNEEYLARKAGQTLRWAYVQESVNELNNVRRSIELFRESQMQHVESDSVDNLGVQQASRNLHKHFLHRFGHFCDAFFAILTKLQESEENWPDCVHSMQSECSYASATRIGAVRSLPAAMKELQELPYKN